jgi:hypothetical protein
MVRHLTGKITENKRKKVWEDIWRVQIGGQQELKM